jgi:serine/threonine protein phosphatase PrpC
MTQPTSIPARAKLVCHALTGLGRVRTHNEDAVLVAGRLLTGDGALAAETGEGWWGLAVVDGMGGNEGGEVASDMVVRRLADWTDWSVAGVAEALRALNRELHEFGLARPELRGLGATIAGLAWGPDGLLAFNVGDARVYRFNGDFLQPLTKDDSLHQVLVEAGQAQGERSAAQHTVLQCLGGRPDYAEIEPHVHPVRLRGPARFLVCSDGITDMLDADALEAAARGGATCEACARVIYEAALAAGGADNLSVIVADVAPVAGGGAEAAGG